jgi:predicted RND superfamily exporter protein
MMMIVFRNFKLGLIAMIPNITPVIITGGLMGFMGEPLEFVTMTIAPMVMGLAVDDTIHFINHVKLDYSRTGSYDRSIKNSFIKVGKALILANIILCATFSAFMTSAVHSMVNMGIYMVVAMLSALIADFTVTPFIIKLIKPFGKEALTNQE